ncbi:FtsX-like permease family protein [Rhodovulum sp. DZ06]|uniref:FtsX-like permease family protein n=1 Tax=Rhodovulum sp. DZ06 TaxID=3425126 RepID=UPI003D34274E
MSGARPEAPAGLSAKAPGQAPAAPPAEAPAWPAFRAALGALLSHWRRRPGQLLALLVGLMAATALWSGVQALNAEARSSYARAASAFSGADLPALADPRGDPLPDALFGALRRAGLPVSPMISGRVETAAGPLRVIGLDILSLPEAETPAALLDGGGTEAASPAGWLRAPWTALLAPETAAALGVEDGEAAPIPGGALPPAAISADMAPGALLVDVGAAQALLGRAGEIDRLLVAGDVSAEAASAAAGRALVLRPPPERPDLSALTGSFHLNLAAFGLLAFLVGLFITHSAIGLAFEQRLPLMRTLRAIGVSARMLAAALAAEIALLAVLAGALGLAAGYAVAGALLPDVAATLRGLYGASTPGALSLSPAWAAAGMGMTLAGAAAASAGAIARAARLSPLAAARPEAWRAAQSRTLRRQRAAAIAIGAAGAGAAALLPGLLSGFALMAAIMLSGALLLPSALAWLLDRGAAAARRPLAQWAWADARQQLSGLSLALMALLLALASSIGVGGMVGGFRDTFHDWLDGRLFAPIYVQAGDDAGRARLEEIAEEAGGALLPNWRTEVRMEGAPVELYGMSAAPQMRAAWPLLRAEGGAWDRLEDGTGAMVSEQFMRRSGLGPGDRVTIPAPGGDARFDVVAVFADYGNPKGQLRLSAERLSALHPGLDRSRFAIAAEDPAAVLDTLRAEGFEAADQAAVKAESRRIFERTFAVTAALDALTLGVAGAALLTALATLASARLPLTAPVWAMGVTRRRIAALELGRTVALALATAALAIPLGVALAWVLAAVVNPAAFGWRLPLHLYPGDWLRLALLAAAAAALAALPSARALARMAPARLLARFAGER